MRFVALGDVGKGNDVQRAVASALGTVCAARACDFALLLGDNLYPDGMTTAGAPRMDEVFTEVYGGLDLDFYAVLGNHDYGRTHVDANAQHQVDWADQHVQFHLPRRYYRFRSGPAAFWALDTDAVFWNGLEPQATWLDDTMGPVEARWKVVFGHHTWRSNGDHGNAGEYEGWSHVPYASGNAVRALFEGHVKGRAQLYLSGHDHNLQSLTHEGVEIVVSGGGASALPLVDRGNTLRAGHASAGFVWVELADAMTLAFYDADAQLLSEHVIPWSPPD
ncbi:MAG: metallophosphoesterase [Myxococcota bacterium]